ncbi:Bacteriophage abortive infection AbiH [Formosa sp. Hel1_31_208]|uniref:bacteriophage abortive infection AbiH family protein n=1 Tax=Formosa sp. Hel1_31_208 TaxID=1798225 RepID=UPI00087A028D|nr:bacteriophage abortive infection AbiH family protein [Formosa sp. Hel1_31_208]SDR88228.1 Bacteriophage abortive infection AbiH [Formosa sp. Hel1_31_208]
MNCKCFFKCIGNWLIRRHNNKTLYIIGNGFDLHHGLKTSYFDFSEYLQQKDSELYNTLESYIDFPTEDNSLWSKFEENLANLNLDEIFNDYSLFLPDIASDDFRSRDMHTFPDIMEDLCESLTTNLLQNFLEFIQSIEYSKSVDGLLINLKKKSNFLTFNYTPTLEKIYGIESQRINYIHNSAFYGSEPIILGHEIEPKSFEEKPPENLSEEELEQWYGNFDYSIDTGKENLLKYFERTYKPSNEVINNNMHFFENLGCINEVFVLGHSVSKVDLPYFEELKKHIRKKAKWNVSFYNYDSIKNIKLNLNSIGVTNINFFELAHILINNQQTRLKL